ncbi:ATP-binding protein [Streptomyces mirabilis]|uniref:ATP-binding protein n=1 Tax=Streptomyces mirabilis TaxID=68239 RepID=UPI0036A10A69
MSTKNGTTQARTSRDVDSELVYLTKALKAPALRDAAARLAERARDEGWSHEEYLAACLQREVAARDSHGAEGRIRAARFPSRKSLELSGVRLCPSGTSVVGFTRFGGRWRCAIRGGLTASVTSAACCRANAENRVG